MKNKKVITSGLILMIVLFFIYSMTIPGRETFPINDDDMPGEIVVYTRGANAYKVVNKIQFIIYDFEVDENEITDIPGYSVKQNGNNTETTLIPSEMDSESWAKMVGLDSSDFSMSDATFKKDIKYQDFKSMFTMMGLIE